MTNKEKTKVSDKEKTVVFRVLLIAIIVLVLFSPLIIRFHLISKASKKFESTSNNTEESIEQYIRDYVKKKYQVSNKIQLEIGNAIESSRLEVLKIFDSEIITYQNNGEAYWLQVDGEGVFTIDLDAAEYLYDEARNMVTVVVPYPELSSCRVNRGVPLLIKDNRIAINGSYKEGEELAANQVQQGYIAIKEYISNNAKVLKSAQDSGEKQIKNLIYQLYDENKTPTVLVVYRTRQ